IRRVTPPYPSLADVGFLGVYVCFLVAVTKLVGAAPRRRFDYELLIDTVLVTLTAGALGYEFLHKPLFDRGGNLPPLLTIIAPPRRPRRPRRPSPAPSRATRHASRRS